MKPRVRVSSNGGIWPNNRVSDGLVNVYTGMGSENSISGNNKFQYGFFENSFILDVMYRESWIARRICDTKPKDAIKNWRTISSKDAEAIKNEEKRLSLQKLTGECDSLSNCYGGAAFLLLTDQPLNRPLNINKIKKGSLRKILVFDRFDMSGISMNMTNPMADSYLQPEFYTLVSGGGYIHHSHFVKMIGEELPRRLLAQTQGWGDSLLRKCTEDMKETIGAHRGIAELIQKANIDVISREGLMEDLTTNEDKAIIERYKIYALMASNFGMSLLDDKESLERLSLSMSGVAPVMEQLMVWISGCAGLPVTKLFGTSAKGLNATGEGDMKNYNDDIKCLQEFKLTPALNKIDEVMIRSALGYIPDDYSFTFDPLEQMNEVEQSTAAYNQAQADATYREILGAEALPNSVIMQNLQANSTYNITDDMIEQQRGIENAGTQDDEF